MREASLTEKLAVARAFAQAAKDAPVWSKGPAVEQMVETLLLLLADIVEILEKEPQA